MKVTYNDRRIPWSLIVFAALALIILGVAIFLGQYRFNSTPSLPKGIYRIEAAPLQRGSLVTFCLEGPYAALAKDRGYLAEGSCPSGLRPLLKQVAGLPGDVLRFENGEITVCFETQDATAGTLQSFADVWPSSETLSIDGQGNTVPVTLQPGIIPPGMALVLARHPGSFDSRYFGLVPLAALQPVRAVFTL